MKHLSRKTARIVEKVLKYPYRKTRAAVLRRRIRLVRNSAKYVAHRGLSGEAPENTVRAFELAAERKFDAMETDIRRTKDHRLVLMHDASLKRMCGVDIPLADLTYEELDRYPITGGNHILDYLDDPKARQIPLLADYLVICRDSGMVPMMELKDNWNKQEPLPEDYLLDILQEVKQIMEDRPVIYVSFNLRSLQEMKKIYQAQGIKNVTFFHLVKKIDVDRLNDYRRTGIHLSIQGKNNKLYEIRKAKEAGIELVVWTVDDPDQARIYIQERIDWIASNYQLWTD